MLIQGPLVIEWAERVQTLLPAENFWIKLEYLDEEQRLMQVTANGKRYESLLLELRQGMFGFVG